MRKKCSNKSFEKQFSSFIIEHPGHLKYKPHVGVWPSYCDVLGCAI